MSARLHLVLALGAAIASIGCSDPVPPASKAGVSLHVFGTGACAIPQGVVKGIGQPPPDSMSAAGKGSPIFDGESGVKTNCRVSNGPNFSVSGSASQNPISFNVSAQLGPDGKGTGTIGLFVPEANGNLTSPADMPCSVEAIVTSSGPQVKPGAVWAKFTCAAVTQPPADSCRADGEFVFENCD